MNIHFVTCARYPTQKAYGVTIGNTMNALTELGIGNSIITWGNCHTDEYKNKVNSLAERPIRLPLRYYKSPLGVISRMSYIANQLIFAIYLTFSKEKYTNGSVFWTREPITLVFHSIMNSNFRYFIELHHSISLVSRVIIKFLGRKNKVQIIALSDKAVSDFSKIFTGINVSYLPMGVPKSFTKLTTKIDQSEFIVGYLGKGMSNGNDNELFEIIYASKIMEDNEDIKFIFIGLEHYYKKSLQKIIFSLNLDPKRIVFIDHIDHLQVAQILVTFDVGILPYPESIYNSERFPLKSLEYAAVGLPIIASDTKVHRNLLDQSFTFFYEKEDSGELSSAILKIKNNPEIHAAMSANARQFALRYTYDERARKFLELL